MLAVKASPIRRPPILTDQPSKLRESVKHPLPTSRKYPYTENWRNVATQSIL